MFARTVACIVCLLCSLAGAERWSTSQAPGDADSSCLPGGTFGSLHPTYPPNMRPLMDSRSYEILLPPQSNPIWTRVDNDTSNSAGAFTEWLQQTAIQCRGTVLSCGFDIGPQDNWLITQHINTTVDGTPLNHVVVYVDFALNDCIKEDGCIQTFSIYKYDTANLNPTQGINIDLYQFIARISANSESTSGTIAAEHYEDVDLSSGGLYLAVRDQSSCVIINRLLVFYYVCPENVTGSIRLPLTIAPPMGQTLNPLQGECVENAVPVGGTAPLIECLSGGIWRIISSGSQECACNVGYTRPLGSTGDCEGCSVGNYKDTVGDGECLPCPAQSNATEAGQEMCPCFEGYFRAPQENASVNCTMPPSSPRNLVVSDVTSMSVSLTWEPPVSNGGRNDLHYIISYNSTSGVQSGKETSISTTVSITGLKPFTEYTVSVSAENGVSGLAGSPESRTVSMTFTTQEAAPGPIDGGVNIKDAMLSWDPPSEPNGVILYYEVRIYPEGSSGEAMTFTTNETSFDANSIDGLEPGRYSVQVRAVTAAGAGDYTEPVTVEVTGSPSSGSGLAIEIIVVIVVVIFILIIVILIVIVAVCICIRNDRVASKQCESNGIEHQQYQSEQIALPERGHRMYVDPTTYASPDEALQEFASEIAPRLIRLDEEIGNGEFGNVYKGIWRQENKAKPVPIAVKTLKPGSTRKMCANFLAEASIMGQFKHPNVIMLYGVVTKVEPVMIVMDFMENGSLYGYLRKYDDRIGSYRLLKMAKCVASGMNYLSGIGYVHRDLAARNVLVGKEEVCKVADFGLSRETVNNEYDVKQGGKIAVRWTAPEAISFRKFTTSSDVWSYGVLLWELYSFAQNPYDDWENQDVLDKLEAGYRLPKPRNCAVSVYNLMQSCWYADHTQRPGFDEIIRSLTILQEGCNGEGAPPPIPSKPNKIRRNTFSRTQSKSPIECSTVEEWLNSIKMGKYRQQFREYGLTDINDCVQLSENDLRKMGITLAGHIHKIMSSVELAQQTQTQQHSMR